MVDPLDRHSAWSKGWLMDFSNIRMGRVAVGGLILAGACAIYPVHNRVLAAGVLGGAALAWSAALWLLAHRRTLRILVGALPLLAMAPFVLPGKPIDPERLRADYVSRLRSYEGVDYVWGGENALGIDCSGLPRKALRDALWSEGWQRANGTAFRKWLGQWWFDSSALALGQGYRGRTRPVGPSGPLWELDRFAILPGDLAVRGDGVHVIVYLGDRRWIEADPNRGKVHSWISSAADGGWYDGLIVHRWVDCEQTPDFPQPTASASK